MNSLNHSNLRGLKRAVPNFLVSLVLPVLMLLSWELAMRIGWLPSSLIASPGEVLRSFVALTKNGMLFQHSWVSLTRLFFGFAEGFIPAICLGAIVGYSRFAERAFAPTVALIAPIPVTAWIPLVIITVGVGEASKSGVIALGTFFPIYFGTVAGIRGTDPKLVEVARIYEKGPGKMLTHVFLPSALESILIAMHSALGLAWVLLVVAEVIASSNGIGWLMWDARNFARPGDMIVGMITAGLLGAITTGLLGLLRRRLLFWKPKFMGVQ